ncbi:MAG: hypothetical protein NPIRA02_23630 [Nitrospirales bacterium]|nr:MAG: hypothetical protein NPIRA02_23630 [Nitrospirales bacterium]
MYVDPGEVSWILFNTTAFGIVLVMTPLLWRLITFPRLSPLKKAPTGSFPIWGWYAIATLAIVWLAAWTRWPGLAGVQLHTFTPLWLSYIVLINALTLMRTRRCLLVDQPKIFVSLFPVSALFWWVFEYLNRFVQNWYYLPNEEVSAFAYVFFGSLSFSIVLPAVYGTYEFLLSLGRMTEPFRHWWKISLRNESQLGWLFLLTASLGFISIGLWPRVLYPLLWISPLLFLLALQLLQGHATILRNLEHGDWRPIIVPAMGGLICGVLWELWNSSSLAHWEYAIPYLHVFEVFEMPILGYAGYLPFGMACIVCIHITFPALQREQKHETVSAVECLDLKVGWQGL